MQGFDHKSNFLSQVLQDFFAEISNDYLPNLSFLLRIDSDQCRRGHNIYAWMEIVNWVHRFYKCNQI